MADLDDEDRKRLYVSLLTGMAREIRDAPGSCDRIGHDWTQWRRREVRPDIDDMPPLALNQPIPNLKIRVVAERYCLQCQKVQRDL
jgi:hypothetical protein